MSANWSTEDDFVSTPDDSSWGEAIPYNPTPRKFGKIRLRGGAAPMKLQFKVKDLIASIQSNLDDRQSKYEAAVKERDDKLKHFTKIVKANDEALAKSLGLEKAEQLTDKQIELAAFKVATNLGVVIPYAPSKPSTSFEDGLLNTLKLVSTETIEVEEGHDFLFHLGRQ